MIDLHTHTKASDGEKTPEELIDLAIKSNINALAITDHDTVDSLEIAEKYASTKRNFLFIPGIEMEAEFNNGQMHILGLFIDYKNQTLLDKLSYVKKERNLRNEKFINELNKMGYEITLDELKEISGGNTIGKPHFARIFLKKNYIKTKSEMFDRFFNQPPLSKYKKFSYSPKDVITMLKNSVILAHPQTLKLEKEEFIEKVIELKSYGLDGLECYHSKQTPEQMKEFKEIAKNLNLLISKGSDYHGPITKPETKLGTGKNNNIVSDDEYTILNNLLKYSNR